MKKYSTFANIIYTHEYILQYSLRRYAIYAATSIFLSIACALLTTYLPAFVIDLLHIDSNYQKVFIGLTFYFILMYIVVIAEKRLDTRITNSTSFKRMFKALDYYNHVMKTEYENVDSDVGKEIIDAGIDSYYDGYHEGFQHIILDFKNMVKAGLGMVTYCVIMAHTVNYFIPILLVAVSALSILVNAMKNRWVYKHKEAWEKIDVKTRYISTQIISAEAAKDIRMYHMNTWLSSTYDSLTAKRMQWQKKEAAVNQVVLVLERLFTVFKYAIIFYFIFRALQNGADASSFVFTLGLMMGIGKWSGEIFEHVRYLQSNNVLVNNSRRFIDINKDISGEDQVTLRNAIEINHEIKLENVSFYFSDEEDKLFDRFNLTIKKGEKIAIVGLNGAGKTTLVKLICGLYMPKSGNLYADGTKVNQSNRSAYTAAFSAIFQDFNIFALTIKENVACCKSDDIDVDRVKFCLTAAGLWEKVSGLKKQIDTVLLRELDEDGVILSGGETQKLLLARCLYKNAQVLILDEPAAFLDAISEDELYEKYAALSKGKTSLFISHRLNSTKFCDRIILLDSGRVMQEGTHDELMREEGAYSKLFKLQASYYTKGGAIDGKE